MDKIEIKYCGCTNCGWYIVKNSGSSIFLHKDFIWRRSTYFSANPVYSQTFAAAPGYYPTQAIAQAYLDEYLRRENHKHKIQNLAMGYGMGKVKFEEYKHMNNLFREEQKMSETMITLSNGVDVSETTIVSALKKAGINVELVKPRHVFEAGDVANHYGKWRFMILVNGQVQSFNYVGTYCGTGQAYFEREGYEFVKRQRCRSK